MPTGRGGPSDQYDLLLAGDRSPSHCTDARGFVEQVLTLAVGLISHPRCRLIVNLDLPRMHSWLPVEHGQPAGHNFLLRFVD